ncbi:MAG: hypothetical protein ACWGQW_02055 [bacterium]
MKIFDFSEGKKGKLLGEVSRPDYLPGVYISETEVALPVWRYTFHSSGSRGNKNQWVSFDMKTLKKEFGVEAICFCMGQLSSGSDAGEWIWHYCATKKWLQANGCVEVREKALHKV